MRIRKSSYGKDLRMISYFSNGVLNLKGDSGIRVTATTVQSSRRERFRISARSACRLRSSSSQARRGRTPSPRVLIQGFVLTLEGFAH